MARYPTYGKVKTRLAADVGKAAALRIYRQLLEHHRREFRETPFAVEWRYTPARAPFRKFLCGSSLPGAMGQSRPDGRSHDNNRCVPQPTGDLGERMRKIFAESFARGYRRVVMIGTDAPAMSQRTVRQAFRLLRRHRAVFQPTTDGGYALIGLAEWVDVFSGMPWSTDRLMAATRRRVRCAELPVTFDIDTGADWRRYAG